MINTSELRLFTNAMTEVVKQVLPDLGIKLIHDDMEQDARLQVGMSISHTEKVTERELYEMGPGVLLNRAEMSAREVKSKLIEMVIPKDTATVAYIEGHLDSGKALTVDYREDGTAVVDSEAIRELLELSGCKELWTHAPRS